MKKKVFRELIGTGLYFLIVLLAILLLITYVGQRTRVDGESMEPTLQDGDNLIVDKISYRFKEPERYDIVVFRPFENERRTYFIKRIIGLPGETIQIKGDGSIYIDGEKLYEAYGKEVIRPDTIGRASDPITLDEDEYFVIGDNRNNSGDSRSMAVGNVHRRQIIGRAWVRIWPLSGFGSVEKGKE